MRSALPADFLLVLGAAFAAGAMACFMMAGDQPPLTGALFAWLGAVACVQMRLLCHRIHGLAAVKDGGAGVVSMIYREVSEPLADAIILVGAGYSGAGEPGVVKLFEMIPLGWCAACAVMATAHMRWVGAALTRRHDLHGPTGCSHPMAVLTSGALIELGQHLAYAERWGIKLVLSVVFLSGLLTCARRLMLLNAALLKKG